jgi:hypothetical protein
MYGSCHSNSSKAEDFKLRSAPNNRLCRNIEVCQSLHLRKDDRWTNVGGDDTLQRMTCQYVGASGPMLIHVHMPSGKSIYEAYGVCSEVRSDPCSET